MYIIKSIFFVAAIIEINEKQIKELKRIYKVPILNKLRLSQNFSKTLLHARKSFLGVRLLVPEIVIAIALLKVYPGYKRV